MFVPMSSKKSEVAQDESQRKLHHKTTPKKIDLCACDFNFISVYSLSSQINACFVSSLLVQLQGVQ